MKPVYAAPVDLGQPIWGIGKYQQGADTQTGSLLTDFLSSIITTLTVVASLAFAIYFIIGGLKWITSGGDKTKAEEAKTQMTQAAIGLIVVVVAYFIIGIISNILGLNILDPAAVLGL
jgi:TRAP-type C4-dicarboxylate transport system permease small subunit